ncbi:MAG: hypothetical protein QM762_30260 [Chryseolinea sp.]
MMIRFLQAKHLIGCVLFFLFLTKTGFAQDTPFTYWNFNNPAALFAPNIGLSGSAIVFEPVAGSEAVSGTGQDFNSQNSLNGDTPGSHLRVNLPIGSKLYFDLPTTGYSAIKVKYETRRSGSGAGTQNISYSLDGVVFTAFTSVLPKDGVPDVIVLDFSGIVEANDNPNFRVLVEFLQPREHHPATIVLIM